MTGSSSRFTISNRIGRGGTVGSLLRIATSQLVTDPELRASSTAVSRSAALPGAQNSTRQWSTVSEGSCPSRRVKAAFTLLMRPASSSSRVIDEPCCTSCWKTAVSPAATSHMRRWVMSRTMMTRPRTPGWSKASRPTISTRRHESSAQRTRTSTGVPWLLPKTVVADDTMTATSSGWTSSSRLRPCQSSAFHPSSSTPAWLTNTRLIAESTTTNESGMSWTSAAKSICSPTTSFIGRS